jgi:hypothetical protein
MKNLKTTMITALLMLAAVGGVTAQEKYEYATVKFLTLPPIDRGIYVSISGQEKYEKIPVKKEALADALLDLTPILTYIKSMTDAGWEIISVPHSA